MKKLLPLCLLLSASLGVAAYARTWTQANTGKTIEGEFVRLKDPQTAIITVGGQQKNVPLAMLSKEDQEFIANQAKAGPGGEKKEALPEGETTVILSSVHLCCGGCKTAAKEAASTVTDVTTTIGDDKTITIKGTTGAKVKETVDALAKAGFYGKSDNKAILINDFEGTDAEVETVKVTGMHLCCGSCVRAVDKAIKTIEGATHTAAEDSTEFEVKGKFKKSAVIAALHAEGFHGTIQ